MFAIESTWNIEKRLSGWIDVPLSDLGVTQARNLAVVLSDPKDIFAQQEYAGIWSSDLQRAYKTGEIAYGPTQKDVRLRELHFGLLEGQHWKAFCMEKHSIRDDNFEAPDGESMSLLRKRVMTFLNELSAGTHLIFTHGGVISVLLTLLVGRQVVANTAIVGINWSSQELLFIRDEHTNNTQ